MHLLMTIMRRLVQVLQFGLVGLKEWLRQIMRAETSKTTEEQFFVCEET